MPQPKPPSSNEKLLILVPKPGVDVRPVTGSGIVGSYTEEETGLVKIDYEGNLYHAGDLLYTLTSGACMSKWPCIRIL